MQVDLTYQDHRLLTGSVAEDPVRLSFVAPQSHASMTGSFAGVESTAEWQVDDNSTTYPDVRAELHGSFGGAPVALTCTSYLGPRYFLAYADLTGQLAGESLQAHVTPVEGAWSSSTVRLEGSLASVTLSLRAAINGELTAGMIEGAIGDAPIRLEAARSQFADSVHLTGTYDGTLPLLALMIGCLLYFL